MDKILTSPKNLHPKCESKEDAFKGNKSLLAEVNFLLLPFFALSRQDAYQKEGMEYRRKITRDGRTQEAVWKVSASSEYGYPGPFDKKVYKSVEELLEKRGYPIKNPVTFTLYELCKFMGKENIGGGDYREIKESLERMVATTIKSEGIYYLKGKECYLDDVFHLFSRVVFTGEKLPSGEVADENYLYINSWLLDNINQLYIRPLDYNFYKSLNSEIARRLYELLGVKFYGLLRKKKPFLRFKYRTLCKLIPLRKQDYISKAKQIMDPAHAELRKKGFLKETRWEEDKAKWYIYYFPGEKARQEADPKIPPK